MMAGQSYKKNRKRQKSWELPKEVEAENIEPVTRGSVKKALEDALKALSLMDKLGHESKQESINTPTTETIKPHVLTTESIGSAVSILPPESFDFQHPEKWPLWIGRFERYRLASELYRKPDLQQVSMLLYVLGQKGENLYKTFEIKEEAYLKYEDVVRCFDSYLLVRKNIVYERAKFLKRRQQSGEPVDSFINDLHTMAESCEFGQLKESLIRDLIVIGVNNAKLSELLQMDENLTLQKAINKARQAESVAEQQSTVRENSSDVKLREEIDVIKAKHFDSRNSDKFFKCRKCGMMHGPKQCPAYNERCLKCKCFGHYSKFCFKRNNVREIQTDERTEEPDYLGELSFTNEFQSCPTVSINVNGQEVEFKMDSGADVSVIGGKLAKKLDLNIKATRKSLFGPGQTKLSVEGVCSAVIQHKEKEIIEDIYVLSNQNTPLLSRNALLKLELLSFHVNLVDSKRIEKMYPQVFEGMGKMKETYKIVLQDNARPYAVMSPRRVAVSLHLKVKQELNRMVEEGVIQSITAPTDWCAPIVVVPRKGGRIRLCVDYTKLNQFVKREQLQLPSVDESLAKLEGGKIFSKLDAANGFWQIPLEESSYRLTTFITPFGRFFFKRLPFGVCSGPEVYQKRISQLISDIPGIVNQADDILVVGATQEEHDERLCQVLKRLAENGVTLNKDKCAFNLKSVVFLGHLITDQGLKPDPEKTKAISSMKEPKNVSELRQFLGMINQLMKFIPNLVSITAPLRCLLKKNVEWIWQRPQIDSFCDLKRIVTSPLVLESYRTAADTRVTADASSYGLGALIEQLINEVWKPVAFASRSMTETESRYAQIEKEALSLTWACEKFSNFILGRRFQLYTDHKPLVEVLGSRPISDLSARLQRFRMRLQQFDYDMVYLPGKENFTADCLSRSPASLEQSVNEIDFNAMFDEKDFVISVIEALPCTDRRLKEIKEAQNADFECQILKRSIMNNQWNKNSVFWSFRHELVLEDDLIVKGRRIFIPRAMRKVILQKIHEGHLGVVKCRKRAQESVWWPGCSTDVKAQVENCVICLKHRMNRKEPLISTPLPKVPWSFLGADLFKFNEQWYLVVQDYYSRFLELVQLGTLTSSAVIGKMKNMFARHGIPHQVRTDGGSQFTSGEFLLFAETYGFESTTSSPHFPQSNGEAENAVAIAKRILLKNSDPNLGLLAYRTTKLESGLSPAELLYGRKLRSNLPSLSNFQKVSEEQVRKFKIENERLQERTRKNFDQRRGARKLNELAVGERVWIKDLRREGKIKCKLDYPRSYMVVTENGTEVRRNRWHLIALPRQDIYDSPARYEESKSSTHKPNGNDLNHQPQRRSERHVRPPVRLTM